VSIGAVVAVCCTMSLGLGSARSHFIVAVCSSRSGIVAARSATSALAQAIMPITSSSYVLLVSFAVIARAMNTLQGFSQAMAPVLCGTLRSSVPQEPWVHAMSGNALCIISLVCSGLAEPLSPLQTLPSSLSAERDPHVCSKGIIPCAALVGILQTGDVCLAHGRRVPGSLSR